MAKDVRVAIVGDASSLRKAFAEAETGGSHFQSAMGGVSAKTVAFGVLMADALKEVGQQIVDLAEKGAKWLPQLGAEFDKVSDHTKVFVGTSYLANAAIEDSFKKVYGSVASSMNDVGDVLDVLYQRLKVTGPQAEGLATQILNLSRITGTDLKANLDGITYALGLWNVSTADAPGLVDEMYRAFTVSGTPFSQLTGDLQGAGLQLQLLGFNIHDVVALSATLGQSGIAITDIMAPLRKIIAAHPTTDLKTAYAELVKGIQSGDTDLKASLTELGNRGGAAFYQLAASGKLNLGDIKDQIDGSKDSVDNTTQAVESWPEKWSKAWHNIQLAISPVASYIFDTMGRIAEAITGKQYSGDALSQFSGQWDKWTTRQKQQFIAFAKNVNDKNSLGGIWDDVVAKWNEAWPKIQAWLDDAKEKIKTWWGEHGPEITDAIVKWWSDTAAPALGDAIRTSIGAIFKEAFDPKNIFAGFAIGNAVQNQGGDQQSSGGGGFSGLLQRLTGLHFAQGGMVPGPVGAPQLALVHGGERVLTPQQQFTSGHTFNVNVRGAADRATAMEITRQLRAMTYLAAG